MSQRESLEVRMDDRLVGTLALTANHKVAFSYSEEWLEHGFSVSPFSLPLKNEVFVPKKDYFDGLFGVFADSLPDAWGQLLLERLLKERGKKEAQYSVLDRLAIVGKSGMGALTYHPQKEIGMGQQMDDLELKMANKSDEIDAANVKLEEAEKIQSAQYEDMKLRIKYMYEDQSVSLAEVFLTSSDMSTMLNKAVYMQEVYNYDRNKLDEMAQTASEIKELKEKLESDKQELDEAQTQLTEKQALLYSTIQETQAKADDVNSQLESAVKKAAEVAAKREQERQAAAANQNQQINTTVTPAKGDSSVASGVVSLAYSLLGVPYVSGGSSPSGFDCSGFTSYLFRQYGISISRSSSAQAYGGTAVNGLANAQPGDVICYPGHVGLYVGGGQMIHANVPGGSVRLVGVNSIGMSVIAIRRYW